MTAAEVETSMYSSSLFLKSMPIIYPSMRWEDQNECIYLKSFKIKVWAYLI